MERTTQALQRELPRLLPRLWRFALRLTRDRSDAEDLVQLCCVRALERRLQWRGGSLPSWLFSIMHSIWLNEVRSRQRHRSCTGEWIDEQAELCVDEQAVDPVLHTLYRQVVQAVDALSPEHREVMLLVGVEGLSYKEAAAVLGIPIGTVMSRLARARLKVGSSFVDARVAGRATAESPRRG